MKRLLTNYVIPYAIVLLLISYCVIVLSSARGAEVPVRDVTVEGCGNKRQLSREVLSVAERSGLNIGTTRSAANALLSDIEQQLTHKSVLRSSQCYIDANGVAHIDVVPRTPRLVVATDNNNYYMDEDGVMWAINLKGNTKIPRTPKLPIVHISNFARTDTVALHILRKHIAARESNTFTNVHIADNGEVRIDERYILGQVRTNDQLQQLLDKLTTYQTAVQDTANTIVNLSYNKQIVVIPN